MPASMRCQMRCRISKAARCARLRCCRRRGRRRFLTCRPWEFIPGYEVRSWNGVGAPRDTPPEIIERLNREINAGLQDETLLRRVADLGGLPIRATPAEMTEIIAKATDKWAKVVKAAGIAPQ